MPSCVNASSWSAVTPPIVAGTPCGRSPSTAAATEAAAATPVHEEVRIGFAGTVLAWILIGACGLIGNWLTYGVFPDANVVAGMAIIVGVVLAGYALYLLLGRQLPAVLWVSIIGMALTYPGTPYAAEIAALTGKLNFLALATPILTFAGLSVAKDVPAFRRLGWRIVVVSFMANAGTFLGAALIAQFFMHAPLG